MENYCVHLKLLMDMDAEGDTPDDAYNKVYNFVMNHLNSIYDRVQFSVVNGSVTDESGSRVD